MRFLILSLTLLLGAPAASAQTVTRLRGTIVSLTGETLVISGRSATTTITFPQTGTVTAASATDLANIKPGLFIGTAAVRQPDGSLKALEVHVFPESMRGTGEGYRPWDLGPQSSMTNGTVGKIEGSNGNNLTIDYKGGQQVVTVPADVPIVSYEPGTRDLLKPGASVVVQATKAEDGAYRAERITVATGNAKLAM
jgi:hypothetical protein